MKDENLKALALANKYLLDVLDRAGDTVSDVKRERCVRMPVYQFAQLQREVMGRGLMTDWDVDVMEALVDAIDSDDIDTEPIPEIRQVVCRTAWLYHQSFKLLKVSEAAKQLGVSTQRVYKMLSDGKLDGLEVRGRRMVYECSVRRRLARKDY